MDRMTTLTDVLEHEIAPYAGEASGGRLVHLIDRATHLNIVVAMPEHPRVERVFPVIIARVIGDYIVIDEDDTDKPLVNALMANAGIPRERIILTYKGEAFPEGTE